MTVVGELLTLRNAEHELVLAPWIGGSVLAYRFRGIDVLRPGDVRDLTASDPRDLAAFPLFPFSGRIANGRFRHGVEEIVLRPNFPPEPHAIHGQGWQNAWRASDRDVAFARLIYEHAGDRGPGDWPWAYSAEQAFELTSHGLSLSLALTNHSARSMPAGMGWHPYFPRAGAMLRADVSEIWPSGDDMIPEHPRALDPSCDLRAFRSVASLRLDHAFDAAGGASVIDWPDRGLRATMAAGEALGHLVVFTPPDAEFFCVEPTSHAPDAVNSDLPASRTGYRELRPEETFEATIRLEVEAV